MAKPNPKHNKKKVTPITQPLNEKEKDHDWAAFLVLGFGFLMFGIILFFSLRMNS